MPIPPLIAIALPIAGLAYSSSLYNATYHVMTGLVTPPPDEVVSPRFRTSLIIPSYAESDYIGRLLQSAHNQIEPFYEIIVADCSPPDDTTRSIAKSYGAFVCNAPYGNISASRNIGASYATGDIFAFIDADCILAQDFMYQATNRLLQGKALVHPRKIIYDSAMWNYIIRTPQIILPRSYVGGCVVVWKDAYKAVGGYDESCNPMSETWCKEDRDFGNRIEARFGARSIGVLSTLIGTSARRFKAQGIQGWKSFDTPVRSRVSRLRE